MKKGFTLAEVLITLTIIGVIAALTIPNLMQKWQDQATVSGVKEAYSILNNAINLAIREHGPVDEWDWPDKTTDRLSDGPNVDYVVDVLKPYLKFSKICYSASGCIGDGVYKNLNGKSIDWGGWQEANVWGKAMLSNGMTIAFDDVTNYNSTKTYWKIRIDINGKKGPDRFGYDVFYFSYAPTSGLVGMTSGGSDWCKLNNSESYTPGYSCSYWILKHGNVDYKYRDVSSEW